MIEASARCLVCCSAGERASRGRAFHTRPQYRERVGRGRSHYHLRNHPESSAVLQGAAAAGERRGARARSASRRPRRGAHAVTCLHADLYSSTRSARRSQAEHFVARISIHLVCASALRPRRWCEGQGSGAWACACADAHARRLFATRSLARTTITFGCRAAPKVGGRGATTLGQSIYLLGAASTHVAAARGYMLYRIHFYRKESAKKKRGLFLALALSLVLSLSHPLSPR